MSRLLGIARRLRLPAAAAVAGGAGTALYVRGAEAEYLAVSESTLPKSYDPAALHAVWSQHPRVALARVCRIAALGSPEGLDETEGRERFVQAATGPDFREGYLSFIQKRKPDFPTV